MSSLNANDAMAQHVKSALWYNANFWLRTVVSLIGGIAVVTILMVGGWVYNFFIALLMLGLLREWYHLTKIPWLSYSGLFLILFLSFLYLVAILGAPFHYNFVILMIGFLSLIIVYFNTTLVKKKHTILWASWGILYLGLPLISLVFIGGILDPHNFLTVLWLFSVVWACDISAYLVGSLVGGPKLWPKVSPNKTWAGLIGGMFGAGLTSSIWAAFYPQRTFLVYFSVGLVLAILAQVGDLLESKLKRHFGVKDSGYLIPGHGGIMDRFDGLLFVSPLVAVYFYFAI